MPDWGITWLGLLLGQLNRCMDGCNGGPYRPANNPEQTPSGDADPCVQTPEQGRGYVFVEPTQPPADNASEEHR